MFGQLSLAGRQSAYSGTLFSPVVKTAGFSLSNGRTVATNSAPSEWGWVSGDRYRSGIRYIEFKMIKAAGVFRIGLHGADISENTMVSDPAAICYTHDGSVYYNQNAIFYGGTYLATGSILGIALDSTQNRYSFYVDNTLQVRVGGPTGRAMTPRLAGASNSDGLQVEMNTGQKPFAYTPPAGYIAWS